MSKRMNIATPRKKKDGGTYWVNIGTAWFSDNGQIQLVFDALPWLMRRPPPVRPALGRTVPGQPRCREGACRRLRARQGQDHPHPGQQQAHRIVLDRARHCSAHARRTGAGLTDQLLHNVLKDRAGLVKIVKLPSGEQIKDYDSISFHKMTEVERAAYIDFAFRTLSNWLGVDVETLTKEAKEQAA
jgi:hypothetical protein